MNYMRKIMALAVVTLTIAAVHAVAKDASTSADKLAKRLEQAVKAKNQAAALELFCWEGVPKDMKTKQEASMHMLFDELNQGLELTSVKVGPLPSDFPSEQVLNGVKYRPNVPVLGAMPYRNSDINGSNRVTDRAFAASVFSQPGPTAHWLAQPPRT
ncbi:MAG: hypothetical protein ABSA83_19935, partial [Verrucomicrobiota bacterium]